MNAEGRKIDASDEDGMSPEQMEAGRFLRVWRRFTGLLQHFGIHYSFTTISGRILTLNLVTLVVLFIGLLYLNDFRDGLIDMRIGSLQAQADIIARSIAQGSADTANDALAKLQKGDDDSPSIDFVTASQLLRTLIEPTKTRGFIYDTDGNVLVDSNKLQMSDKSELYSQAQQNVREHGVLYRWWVRAEQMLRGEAVPLYKDNAPYSGKSLREVDAALKRSKVRMVGVNEAGETVLSVATPIELGGSAFGALLLMTPGGEIDSILAKERLSIMKLWALVLVVTSVFSFLLAGTIVGPIHRLAVAAEKVRQNIKKREEVPDFTHRKDEIGDLSAALRDMTSALYKRLDAIESFAADVAHELKNPLTSLRSATETLSIVRNDEDRNRLVQIIQHDVKRLNRLITDISDASRLDAELAREGRRPMNVARLLDMLCGVVNDIHREGVPKIELQISGMARGAAITSRNAFRVNGHESRIGQVINNLIDNAISFSPPNGRILVTCRHIRKPNEVEITVEDEGPGIRPENLERIFERFYTDRPSDEEFGQNSGLGLNISRQIVTAHGGRIWAENRVAPPSKEAANHKPGTVSMTVIGARFVIRLPAL